MAKGRKRKDSDGENVVAYKHETETRKNAVPAELSSYDTSRPKPIEDKEKIESMCRRVREFLESARSNVYRAVNFTMVQAYWHIGRVIVEEERTVGPLLGTDSINKGLKAAIIGTLLVIGFMVF